MQKSNLSFPYFPLSCQAVVNHARDTSRGSEPGSKHGGKDARPRVLYNDLLRVRRAPAS